MKRFLLKLTLFVFPWMVILGFAELYVENLPNIARDKHQWMLRHSEEVRTLVLGHSHTLYGIRPNLLGPHAYNLAQQSQTFRYDHYLLTHYPMPNLRTVILPFNYSSLWEDFEHQPKERYQAIRYRIYMDCDIHPRLSWYGFEIMAMPLVREKLRSLYAPAQNQWDSLGWATEYTRESRAANWDNGKLHAEGNTYTDTTIVALNETLLRNIFITCRQRHIRIVLLNTPVSPQFRQWESLRQKSVNQRVLTRLLADFPEVCYLDLESDSRFDDADFYDSDHLNTEGAAKLSRIVSGVMDGL